MKQHEMIRVFKHSGFGGKFSVPQPHRFANLPDETWRASPPFHEPAGFDLRHTTVFTCSDGRSFKVEFSERAGRTFTYFGHGE